MRATLRQKLHVLDAQRGRPPRRLLERRLRRAAADPRARRRRHRARQHAARGALGTGASPARRASFAWVAESPALQIAFPQDEYNHAHVLDDWLAELGVEVVFSVYGPEHRDLLYPRLAAACASSARSRATSTSTRPPVRRRACCRTTAGRSTWRTGPTPCRRALAAWASSRRESPRQLAPAARAARPARRRLDRRPRRDPRRPLVSLRRLGPRRARQRERGQRDRPPRRARRARAGAAGRAAVALLRRVRRRAAGRLGRHAARADRAAPPGGRSRAKHAQVLVEGHYDGVLEPGRALPARCGRTSPTSTRSWSAWATAAGAGARRARVRRPRAQRALRLRRARRAHRAGAGRGTAARDRRSATVRCAGRSSPRRPTARWWCGRPAGRTPRSTG